MDGNVGNVEFDGDGTVISNGGSDGVGCEYSGGCSGVEFLFAAFVGGLAFFVSLPRPPPSNEDFFAEFGDALWGYQRNVLRAGHCQPFFGIL